jgi:hypothetical protein
MNTLRKDLRDALIVLVLAAAAYGAYKETQYRNAVAFLKQSCERGWVEACKSVADPMYVSPPEALR